MTVRTPFLVASVAVSMLTAAPLFAQEATDTPSAPTPESCAQQHERSQVQRLEGRLLEARDALRHCADAACPALIRTDCAEWLVQVQQNVPAIVPIAQSDAGDETNVRVFLDGKLVAERLTGQALEVNPGAHQVRFELEGYPPVSQNIVVREGERRHVVPVRFSKQEQPPEPGTGPRAPTSEAPDAVPSHRPIPVLTYVLGGVAVVAAGTGTFFGLRALSEKEDRRNDCAPFCSDDQADGVRNTALVADIAFGVAAVSAGAALVSFLLRPEVPIEQASRSRAREVALRPRFLLAPLPGGAQLGAAGAF